MDWRPIESAPKDGTEVLCVCMKVAPGREQYIGKMAVDSWKDRYHGFGLFNNQYWPATHWMPLPDRPSTQSHDKVIVSEYYESDITTKDLYNDSSNLSWLDV